MTSVRPGAEVPRTEAGRALFLKAAGLWWQPTRLHRAGPAQIEVRQAILAIEHEAAALDVGRLAQAIDANGLIRPGDPYFRETVSEIAAQYARLRDRP